MGVAVVVDAQNCVAFVARGAWHIAQGLLAPEPDTEGFARAHAFELEFGPHESHRADLAGNVDVMVRLYRL